MSNLSGIVFFTTNTVDACSLFHPVPVSKRKSRSTLPCEGTGKIVHKITNVAEIGYRDCRVYSFPQGVSTTFAIQQVSNIKGCVYFLFPIKQQVTKERQHQHGLFLFYNAVTKNNATLLL